MKCPNPKCQAENEARAHFCHICGTKLVEEVSPNDLKEVDKIILDVIKENSYSRKILAAYRGRRYANSIALKSFGETKENYKEYVEMLMSIHYPNELEKSILGRRCLIWVIVAIVLGLTLFGLALTIPILIWLYVSPYKKLKSMCV